MENRKMKILKNKELLKEIGSEMGSMTIGSFMATMLIIEEQYGLDLTQNKHVKLAGKILRNSIKNN
jgi:hypothetical protein